MLGNGAGHGDVFCFWLYQFVFPLVFWPHDPFGLNLQEFLILNFD